MDEPDYTIKFEPDHEANTIVCRRWNARGRGVKPVIYDRYMAPAVSILPQHNQDEWHAARAALGWPVDHLCPPASGCPAGIGPHPRRCRGKRPGRG